MKINKINFDNSVYQNSGKINKNNKPSFQGYVNGKFFKDEIIKEAQSALKNPDWKNKLLTQKISLGETLATWHKREGSNDIVGRVLMGIFTLGLTEVTWGLAHAAMDASDNKKIDNHIKEIEDCIENLKSPPKGESEN